MSVVDVNSDPELIRTPVYHGLDPYLLKPTPISAYGVDESQSLSPQSLDFGIMDLLFPEEPIPLFEVTEEELDEAVNTTAEVSSIPGWDSFQGAMLSESCAFFAQEMLTGPSESPYNGRFLINDHHEEWDDLIAIYDRICILAARDHGKTFYLDFAYPIWKATTQPGSIGFIFSATKDQAIRILGDIKEELETNPKLKYLVPSRKDGGAWSATHIRLSNGSNIYARGFGTKVRGAHPHWIVVDDGLNDETVYSELIRKKQTDYFFTAITNMCVPGGQIIVVGTPFHAEDLYAQLEKNPAYAYRKYSAIRPDRTALWEDRYSLEDLESKKYEIGSIRFTREFMCDPISDDMSLFPGYLFQGDPVEVYNLRLGMSKEYWEQAGIQIFIGVDFAISANVEADYVVIWVMGVDKFGNRWVIDIIREHGIGFQMQLSLINSIARKYDPAMIFLEANQMQRIFGDELIRTTDLPIQQFTTGVQKNSLDKGVPSLRILFENGKIRIPRGDTRSIELTDIWIGEMRSFTWHEGKLQGVGKHDDTVMAFWICDQAIRQGSFDFSFGEGFEDTTDEEMQELLAELTGTTTPIKTSGSKGGAGDLKTWTQEELLAEIARRAQPRVSTPVESNEHEHFEGNLVDPDLEYPNLGG